MMLEKMVKKYKLLKDFGTIKAGTIFVKSTRYAGFPYIQEMEIINPSIGGLSECFVENNNTWFEPIEERWKPREENKYYYITDHGSPNIYLTEYRSTLDSRYEFGNVFRTEEQAIEAAKRVKETLRKFHEEIGE